MLVGPFKKREHQGLLLTLTSCGPSLLRAGVTQQLFPAEEEPALRVQPQELRTRLQTPAGPLGSALRAALTDRGCIAQEHNFLRGLQMHSRYLENTHFCRWKGNRTPVGLGGNKPAEQKDPPDLMLLGLEARFGQNLCWINLWLIPLQDVARRGAELRVSGLLVALASGGWASRSFLSPKTHSVGRHSKPRS